MVFLRDQPKGGLSHDRQHMLLCSSF
jgi:hypothetical protein